MRFARVPVAVTAAVALSLSGLVLSPAQAATVLACLTNPVNASNQTMLQYSGTGTGPQAVTATGGGVTTNPQPATPTSPTEFSGAHDVSSLPDGTVTLTAQGATDTASCTTVKDATAPAQPTLVVVPSPTVNNAQRTMVTVTATSTEASVELKIADTSTGTGDLVRFPVRNGDTWEETFDVTSLVDGTLTVTATAIDAAQNRTARSTTVTKDVVAPTSPTPSFFRSDGSTAVTVVNDTNPRGSGTGLLAVTGAGPSTADKATFVLTVTDSLGAQITRTSTAPEAAYRFDIDPYALADGTLTFTVVATDEEGNVSPTATRTLQKDTAVPAIANLAINNGAQVNAATDNAVVVTGIALKSNAGVTPAEPGTTVTVTICCGPSSGVPPTPTTLTASNVAIAADGRFTATFNVESFADGTLTATADPTDPAGNSPAPVSTTQVKDTLAPAAPTVGVLSDAIPGNVTAVSFSGTRESGSSVVVTITDAVGAKTVLTEIPAAASSSYSGSFDATALAQGVFSATAVATDAAGNTSAVSAPRVATKDTRTLALVSTSPVDGGKAAPSTTVRVTFNEPVDQSVVAPIQLRNAANAPIAGSTSYADAGRTIVFTPSSTLPDGVYEAQFTGREDAPFSGSGGARDADVTGNLDFLVDATVPSAPVLTTITPSPIGDAGKTMVKVSGTMPASEVGTTVTVVLTDGASTGVPPGPNTVTRTATVAANGTFTTADIDVTGLQDGPVTARATARDASNNGPSAPSNTLSTVKDTVAPAQPGAATASDTTEAAPSTTVAGTAEAGSLVRVVLSQAGSATTATETVTAASDGSYSVMVNASAFADGVIDATISATDAAGNTGPTRGATFSKDATGPGITALAATPVSAASAGRTTVTGQTNEAGTTVVLTVTDKDGKSTSASPTPAATSPGAFSAQIDVSLLADGPLTVSAVAKDSKANSGDASVVTVAKDTVAPVVDALAASTANANATPSTTTITGTTEPGASVATSVTNGSTTVAGPTVTADASTGAFSAIVDVSGFADGQLTARALASDAIGNASNGGTQTTTTFLKDTVDATIASTTPAAGSTVARPATVTVTFTEPVTSATTVTVTRGSTAVPGSTTFDSARTVATFTPTDPLTDGAHTVSVATVDDRGNTGSDSKSFTVDATGPSITGLAATDVQRPATTTTVTGTVSETGADVVVRATDGTTTVTKTLTDLTTTSLSTTLDISTLADKADIAVTAVATDGLGNDGSTASTTLAKTPPTAPAKPTAVTASVTRAAGTADLAWTAPAGTISSYRVVVAPAAGTVTYPTDRTATTAVVTGLTDGTTYTFTVLATAHGVEGPASDPVTATPYTVPGAPTSVAGSGNDGALALTWTAPASNGGRPVSSYTVTLSPSAGTITYPADRSTTGATVTGLAAGTAYTISVVATNLRGNGAAGTGTATSAVTVEQDRFVALAGPVRALDSRNGTGTTAGLKKGAVTLDLTSRIPASATGAVLNVTVTQPETGGFVVVHPFGTTQPPTSNVNFAAGQTQANEVVTALAGRKATVFVSGNGRAHVVVDVVGYFTPETGTTGYLTTLAPKRVLGAALARNVGSSSGSSSVDVDLSSSLPAGATGAILNVTVASPSQSGFVVAYPSGATQPPTSNVNFAAGQVQANEVITRVSADGKVRLTLSRGQARLIVDVVGAIVPSAVSGATRFTPLAAPDRVLDTRTGLGTTGTARRTASTPVTVTLPSSVPADAKGVILNVTSTDQIDSGFVVAYPFGSVKPGTSNVNFRQGVNQANEVVVGISAGKVTLAVGGGSGSPASHLIADVVGYLR